MWALKGDRLLYAVLGIAGLLSLAAILLSGCTYASVRVDRPDGSTIKGKYVVFAQNRSLKFDPKAGMLESKGTNEPAQELIQQAGPVAATAIRSRL